MNGKKFKYDCSNTDGQFLCANSYVKVYANKRLQSEELHGKIMNFCEYVADMKEI